MATYSNLRAATWLGNPDTSIIISQGRSESLDVRAAPPLASPLCCLSRLGGFGVEPMYRDLCRMEERRTYTVYKAGSGFVAVAVAMPS